MMKKSNLKRQLLLWMAVVLLLQPTLFSIPAAAEETVVSEFCDTFEDYSHDGVALYAKHWDNVKQDADAGSKVTVDHNDGNGFAAFFVRSGAENGEATFPSASARKNNINNQNRTLVYEGSFYTFDQNAQMTVAFTNGQGSELYELLLLRGSQISVKENNNNITPVSNDATMNQWNRIALVLDGAAGKYRVYLNGKAITDDISVSLGALDMGNLSWQIAVKNCAGVEYTEGRIYLDNAYIYEGAAPVENIQNITSGTVAITTYLNRQFTGISLDGRAHGVASFTSAVSIVDSPSSIDKSAQITLGSDGAYFPLDQTAAENFTAKLIYQSNDEITLFAKDENGKVENLVTLPAHKNFDSEIVTFHFDSGTCALRGGENAELSLAEIASLGFSGEGVKLTLNKFFAYSGAEEVEDSYFKDYQYQERARDALVTTEWKNNYNTLVQGVFMGIDFYQVSVFGNKIRINGQPPRVFNNEPYVPAEVAVVALGGELLEATEEAPVRFAVRDTVVELGNDEIYHTKNTNYVTAQRMAAAFGLTLSWDGEYLLGFGTKGLFSATQDQDSLKAVLYYQRPTGQEIYDRIEKNGSLHPRVLVDSERLAEVRENIENNATLKSWYDKIIDEADGYLDAYTLYYYRSDATRLLSVSNVMVSRMWALGLAYQMTGDTKYAEAAWRDLEAVSNFEHWNPSHYLDVATMSLGVSFGYSWFYDYLTDEQKDTIVEGFIRCGLDSYLAAIESNDWWTYVNSNWNPWCHGGILSGLVAMSDRLGDRGMYALERMFPYMEYLYEEFVPNGAWKEGTAYLAATLRYVSMWCSTLETATGKDFGYWDLPGMDLTAYYGEAISGGGGVYNYGDNTESIFDCEAQEWFAYKFNDSALMEMRFNNMGTRSIAADLYDLVMMRPEMMGGESTMDRDLLYSNTNIVSMRTSWTDSSNGFFVGAKGGLNGESHFHYDLGGFVMDVGGVRFAYELGREGYAITANDTNTYQYKKRAEGHNTYVINPDETPGQGDTSEAKVVEFETKEKGGYAVIDLSQAYNEALDMKRGFFLTNDRQSLLIQDEVQLSQASEVYWFMHTQGEIEIENDGKTAYITNSGVTIRMDILDSDNGGATFDVMAALPLDTTPWLEGQGTNDRYQKLFIHWDSVQEYTLSVVVNQVIDRSLPGYSPEVVPISDWEIEDGTLAERPKLNSITMNGVQLADFSTERYSYGISLDYDTEEKPVFDYVADDSVEVTVEEIAGTGAAGTTKFIVKSKDTGNYAVYTVTTNVVGYIGQIPGTKELRIANVTASAEPEYAAGNRAVCVLDDDYVSRWTAEDDAWIMLELEEATEVYALGIAWYLGDQRNYKYEVEISEDGENWTEVYAGSSSGTTTQLESILLGNQKAKYVRYQGHGHAAGTWNNITTMRVYGR